MLARMLGIKEGILYYAVFRLIDKCAASLQSLGETPPDPPLYRTLRRRTVTNGDERDGVSFTLVWSRKTNKV